MYGLPISYNPFAPTHATPPSVGPMGPTADLPAVDVARLRLAEQAGAGWLSSDGLRAYRDDRGNPELAWWDDETGAFGSWWYRDEIADDAVRI